MTQQQGVKISQLHYAMCVAMNKIDNALTGFVNGWNIQKGLEVVEESIGGNLAGLLGEASLVIRPEGWKEDESIQLYFQVLPGASPWKPIGGVIRNGRLLGITELGFEISQGSLVSNDSRWKHVPHRPRSIKIKRDRVPA